MEITRISMFSGIKRTKTINISEKQYNSWLKGELLQDAAPHLSNDDREFLITGVIKEEWDATFWGNE